MITIDDVINFILSTDDLTALPTIMDALTQRFAGELGMSSEMPTEGTTEEMPTEEMSAEETPAEEAPVEEGQNQPIYF